MSYYYNGNYNAQSSVNGGYPMRGGQGNGIAPATHGHSAQHPQALRPHAYQQPPAPQQRAQDPPQQAPAPRQTLPPPAPPIHFVLDRQYTLCRAPSPHYAPARGGALYTSTGDYPRYTPARDGALYTPARDGAHYTPARDSAHYTPTQNLPQQTPARYVPPALRNAPHYTPSPSGAHYTPAPAPHTPYATAAAPALVPFRCAHPQCGGRVVMVASAREHMWAAHRVRM